MIITPSVIGRDLGFTEGPVVTQAGGVVVVSMDHGRVYRQAAAASGFEPLASTGGAPNGATEGAGGRIYVAQTGGKWGGAPRNPDHDLVGGVQAIVPDGGVSWVTLDPIAPNDLCFGPDGLLYITDPTRWCPARDDGRLWRCDPEVGEAELLLSMPWYPNGIGFGLEDDAVYVADTGGQRIVRFPLSDSGIGKPEVAVQLLKGFPDGFAFDRDGNLVICAISRGGEPGEVQTWSPDRRLLDVWVPGAHREYTNVALSPQGRLIVTDSDGGQVLAVDEWPCPGLPLHPFRRPVSLGD